MYRRMHLASLGECLLGPLESKKEAKAGCATMQTCAKDTAHSFLHRQKMEVHSEAAMEADVPFLANAFSIMMNA